MLSLCSFLEFHGLSSYYQLFIDAGATDRDLPQLIRFDQRELNELIQSVGMLPFHAAKLKNALRALSLEEYTSTKVSTTVATLPASENEPVKVISTQLNEEKEEQIQQNKTTVHPLPVDVVVAQATIYGKHRKRPLTNYEKAINQASIDIAHQNPSLLMNKGSLFDQAKKVLLEQGYQYKRGKSRSKLSQSTVTAYMRNHVTTMAPVIREAHANHRSNKRKSTIQLMEMERNKLQLEISEHEQTKNNHHRASEPDIHHHIEQLKEKYAQAMDGIHRLKTQERKHQWYKRRKTLDCETIMSTDETIHTPSQLCPRLPSLSWKVHYLGASNYPSDLTISSITKDDPPRIQLPPLLNHQHDPHNTTFS